MHEPMKASARPMHRHPIALIMIVLIALILFVVSHQFTCIETHQTREKDLSHELRLLIDFIMIELQRNTAITTKWL